MNNDLAPSYLHQLGDYWILWYSKSNNYSVVESEFKTLLEMYLNSHSIDAFSLKLSENDSISNAVAIAEKLQLYLENCNATDKLMDELQATFNPLKSHIQKFYSIGDKTTQINYDSELVEKTIHPSIAHLEVAKKSNLQNVFDIYLDNDLLCLFKDHTLITAVAKRNYHLLQGKFVMQLFSLLHNKTALDWIGTFHGSTISDGENSILFVGQSGKGKSTLCALLYAHGYTMLADDVSPLGSNDLHIYHNPSAISIKEGAFNTLKPLITDFNKIPVTVFNKTKGKLKYIPSKTPVKQSYPCKCIVMVNYSKGANTTLEELSIKTLLETLIPDSWLSPKPDNAKQFLNWLASVTTYTLTYSNTEDVLKEVATLFKTFSKN